MGGGIRRLREGLRNTFHIGKLGQPTKIDRLDRTLKEAAGFARSLRSVEAHIKAQEKASLSFLQDLTDVMSKAAPIVYDNSGPDSTLATVATVPHAGVLGGDFSPEELQRVREEMALKLQAEVLGPLHSWSVGFAAAQKKVEAMRRQALELDSRRRTVIELNTQLERERAKLAKANAGKARDETAVNTLFARMQHKQAKAEEAAIAFTSQEEVVFNVLHELVGQAEWLRNYVVLFCRLQAYMYVKTGNALHTSADVPTMPDFAPNALPLGLPSATSADLGTPHALPPATGADLAERAPAPQVPAGKEALRALPPPAPTGASPLSAGALPHTPEPRAPLAAEGGVGTPSPGTPTRAGFGAGDSAAAIPNPFLPAAQAKLPAGTAAANPFVDAPVGKPALAHSHSAKSDYVDANEHY